MDSSRHERICETNAFQLAMNLWSSFGYFENEDDDLRVLSKDEDLAVSFEECVKDGTARIVLNEDTSINAAPKELQEEYELALVSGDEEHLVSNCT
jgi:hypothetical protein